MGLSPPRVPRALLLAAGIPLALGCRGSLSPLQNRIAAGQEPFVVFGAAGEGGEGDLFAVKGDGGQVFPVTFSLVHEAAPALDPTGVLLAFVRSRAAGDTASAAVWVMDLLGGRERRLTGEGRLGSIERLAWARDGTHLYVRAGGRTWRLDPAARSPAPVPVDSSEPAADSAFLVLLGEPPVARVAACVDGRGLCARTRAGEETFLTVDGEVVRWGGDSVAYLAGGILEVRPLAGGRTRRPRWRQPPPEPRGLTVFPGTAR